MTIIADGYTDCSYALNYAIQNLPYSGGEILLPEGDILLNKPLILDVNNVSIRGRGRETTRLLINNPEGSAIIASKNNQTISRTTIRDLTINTKNTLDVGAGIKIDNAIDARIENCIIANTKVGIDILNSSFVYVCDCEIIDPAPNIGIGILIHGDTTHNDHYLNRVFIQCRKHVVSCKYGIKIINSQAFWINYCGVFHCATGMIFCADNGQTLEHGFLGQNAVDTCVNDGIVISCSSNSLVRRIQSIGDWVASNGGHGIILDPLLGNIDDISFINSRIYNNHKSGISIGNSGTVVIDGSNISGNGLDNVSSGIDLIGICQKLAVRNSIICAFSGFDNTHKYGIHGLQNSQQCLITCNILEPNLVGSISHRPLNAIISSNIE